MEMGIVVHIAAVWVCVCIVYAWSGYEKISYIIIFLSRHSKKHIDSGTRSHISYAICYN